MFLSSTRCGIIACRYLVSGYNENRYITAPEIATKYNMNVRALMPALRQMTRSGILRSRVGGKEPGFIFSKPPKDITMFDVLASLEGNNEVACCVDLIAGLKCDCKGPDVCSVYVILGEVIREAKNRFAMLTIEEHAQEVVI